MSANNHRLLAAPDLAALGELEPCQFRGGAGDAQFGVSSGPSSRRNQERAPCALQGGGVQQADALRVRGGVIVPGAERASP